MRENITRDALRRQGKQRRTTVFQRKRIKHAAMLGKERCAETFAPRRLWWRLREIRISQQYFQTTHFHAARASENSIAIVRFTAFGALAHKRVEQHVSRPTIPPAHRFRQS